MKNEDCWYKEVCTYNSCVNCIRYSEMKYLIDHSNIPKNRQHPQELEAGVDYRAFVKLNDIKLDADAFVDNGDNLYICSTETGNGKTSWAIKILLKYFDKIWAGNGFRQRGLFIHVPTFLTKLKDFTNPLITVYREMISNVDLVVWDDIASTKLSDYDIQQLLIFIDGRLSEGQANIYTGNVTKKEELAHILGERLASRIYSGITIEFKGKDRRK